MDLHIAFREKLSYNSDNSKTKLLKDNRQVKSSKQVVLYIDVVEKAGSVLLKKSSLKLRYRTTPLVHLRNSLEKSANSEWLSLI